MTEYDRDDLDYELDDISDRLEELEEDEEEYGRFISDDLEILSDYFDLKEDEGLTAAEFKKYKNQCMRRIKTKKYNSAPDVNAKALKFAHSLHKVKCLTKDEYEMIKQRIEQLSEGNRQSITSPNKDYKLHYNSATRKANASKGEKLYDNLRNLFQSMKSGEIDEEKYLIEKESIIDKIVNSDDIAQEYTYKYAGELYQIGAITSDEYQMIIQDAMDDRLSETPANEMDYESDTNESCNSFLKFLSWCKKVAPYVLNALLWCINIALYIVLIPLKVGLWLLEVSLFGYKAVWQRDELERIMRERKDD